MNLFKGYIPTKNKACLKKFTGSSAKNIQTYREVKELPEFAGILDEDTILIDIDDFRQSEILFNIVDALQLRCRVYETTRGKHFLFKNNGQDRCRTHCNLAIGIESDIKLGCRNSYSILKYNGKERNIIYDIFQDEEYQEAPKWLLPVDGKTDFLSLKAGEGRNQSLFNYILTLQANDFTVEEARETIRLINKFVLEDKLEDEEIETILRDDSFKKPVFFKKNTFLFDKFAMYLKNNLNVIRIDGRLHMYEDGIYKAGEKRIEAEMIKMIPNLSANKRREVMAYLDLLVPNNTPVTGANYIAFKNGVYNIVDGTLEDFTNKHIITNRIDHNYNPAAKCEIVDRTLDKLACGDKEIRALLEEAIGYCFFRRNELRKCFILTGDKRNGKSTYLSVIETILGEDNIASLDLKELDKQFKTAELFGKLANIGDDIGDELTTDALNTVIEENDGVSCVCFMGGKFNEIKKLLEFIQNNHPSLRAAWYTGESELPRDNGLLELLDYIKIGPYIKDKGGLDSKGTNQRMYEVISDKNGRRILNDITYKFQK